MLDILELPPPLPEKALGAVIWTNLLLAFPDADLVCTLMINIHDKCATFYLAKDGPYIELFSLPVNVLEGLWHAIESVKHA